MDASQVDRNIQLRLKRQELLNRVDAPLMFFVIDEAVVHRIVGDTEIMRRQLQQLIEFSDMSNVTIEVIPFTAGLLPGLQSPFVIHEFPDAADDDVLYLENPRGSMLNRDDTDEILSFREDFERMRQASLGPEGTVDFLREVIEELR
jgi:hypothetical protein